MTAVYLHGNIYLYETQMIGEADGGGDPGQDCGILPCEWCDYIMLVTVEPYDAMQFPIPYIYWLWP